MSLMHKVLPDEMDILDKFTYDETQVLVKLSEGLDWSMYDVKTMHGKSETERGLLCTHTIFNAVTEGWVHALFLEPCVLAVNIDGSVDPAQQKRFDETLERMYSGIRLDRMIYAGFMRIGGSNCYVINRSAIREYLVTRAAATKCYENGKLVVDELLKTIKEHGKAYTLERLVALGNVPDYYYIVSQYAEQN